MRDGTGDTPADRAPGLQAKDFVTMMSASSMCVLIHDPRSRKILWTNPAACDMLEFTLEDVEPSEALRMSDAAQQYNRIIDGFALAEALERGACRIEWQYVTKSGRDVLTDALAVRVELAAGPAVMVQFRDVERDQQVEDELRLTASYVEALSRHTAAGLLVLAPDGTVLHATDRALVQFGDLARVDMVGASLTRFCQIATTIDDSGALRGWAPALEAADPIATIRLRLVGPDSTTTWLGGTMERLATPSGNELLLTVHDISDWVKDQQRRALELQHENYLARYNVMGDMAMAIAHELGQPLAAAGNFLAGVRARTSALAAAGTVPAHAADQIDYGLGSAYRQVDRASTIVATLRAFVGHLEHVEQTVDLNDVIADCLYFIRLRAAPHGIDVTVDLCPTPALVRCERVLTGQVVLNFCFNAIDELTECDPSRRQIVITTRIADADAQVLVDDRGRGIPRDPFAESFTLKKHGSGIGLALSHRIITRQHGTIWAERRETGGSRFGFGLPLV